MNYQSIIRTKATTCSRDVNGWSTLGRNHGILGSLSLSIGWILRIHHQLKNWRLDPDLDERRGQYSILGSIGSKLDLFSLQVGLLKWQ